MSGKPGLWIAVLGLVIGMLWSQPSLAAVRVYVSVPPPPVIVETAPAPPSPRHVWIAGYHRWDGHAYVWVPGHYAVPHKHYKAWAPGHWAKHHNGWYWVEGHWH
jgi:WXXGXW repeat (2 copies)